MMMRKQVKLAAVIFVMAAAGSMAQGQVVRSGAAANAAGIQSAVDTFRADLGTLNGNLPQSFVGGRREINWDAVPDAFSSPNAFPGNFFNGNVAGRARGVVFSTPGSGFQVSANATNPTSAPVDFGNIDASYTGQFAPFSAQRLFSSVGSTVTDYVFFVPGTNTPATSRGFGVVFSDVDLAGSASVELFDIANNLLGRFDAPASGIGQEGFSFVGISYADPVIATIRIHSGTIAIGAGVVEQPDATVFPSDVVVMDDFIFGEQVAVPTPGAALLVGMGMVAGGVRRRRAN